VAVFMLKIHWKWGAWF